ncbi:MAG TPA: rhodanese-like domain-containing protein [Nocardioides sp.]|nr:rhodanese-like domain-containing protein [Nocardioides sp.]
MRHEIDVDQLAERLAAGATVVDVREPVEYAAAHVADTRLIPMGQLAGRLQELDRSHPVHLICRSGNRSGAMCDVLTAAGFEAVNVRGGIEAWAASGRPVEVAR